MSTFRPIVAGVMGVLISGSLVGIALVDPAEAADPVSFHRDVRPILQAKCQGCHQPAKPLGGYVLTDYASLLKPGETGFDPVVAGKPAESYLVSQIVAADANTPAEMPKDGQPLSAVEVDVIKRWVQEGAKDDSPAQTGPLVDAEHPPVYQLPPVLTSVAYSPDGQFLAVSGYHEVLLHKADGSGLVARLVGLSERIESAVFSPDGKKLAVTGGSPGRFGEVQIWDVATKQLERSIPVTYDTVYGVSWSGDGTRVAFGCADNTLRAVNVATGEEVLYQGAHEDWVLGTHWSNDDSHLVSVSRDRSLKLTEVKTQRFIDNITSITPGALKGGLMAVDRRPGTDELLVGGADGAPKLYRMFREKARRIGDDFNLIRKFPEMPGRIFSLQFNADGTRLVAGSSYQGRGEVRVFETESGKQICQCEGQQGGVFSVAFSPDGSRVAAGGFDGKVRINDAATGKLIAEFVAVPLEKPDATAATN